MQNHRLPRLQVGVLLLLIVSTSLRCDGLTSSSPTPAEIVTVQWPDTLTLGDTFAIRLQIRTPEGATVVNPRPKIVLSSDQIIRLLPSDDSVVTALAIGRGSVVVESSVSGYGLSPVARSDTLYVMQHWTSVSAGADFTCALAIDRKAYCWGKNNVFKFGTGADDSAVPVLAAGGLSLAGIAAGLSHACGLSDTGRAFCWGSNSYGQLGTGSDISFGQGPAPVAGGLTFTSVSAGLNHTCGISTDGVVHCWGSDRDGQLGGDAPTGPCPIQFEPEDRCRLTPAPVSLPVKATQVTSGAGHSCALGSDGRVFCWGSNRSGQSGDGSASTGIPVGASRNLLFSRVETREYTTCGIALGGDVYCWGSNAVGLLGTPFYTGSCGQTPCDPAPRLIPGGFRYTALFVGNFAVCGITEIKSVACWGLDMNGALGVPGLNCPNSICTSPQPMGFAKPVKAIAGSGTHNCLLAEDGALYCWGWNYSGELGDGTTVTRTRPIRVVDPK